jgi:hypothetical protein
MVDLETLKDKFILKSRKLLIAIYILSVGQFILLYAVFYFFFRPFEKTQTDVLGLSAIIAIVVSGCSRRSFHSYWESTKKKESYQKVDKEVENILQKEQNKNR